MQRSAAVDIRVRSRAHAPGFVVRQLLRLFPAVLNVRTSEKIGSFVAPLFCCVSYLSLRVFQKEFIESWTSRFSLFFLFDEQQVQLRLGRNI